MGRFMNTFIDEVEIKRVLRMSIPELAERANSLIQEGNTLEMNEKNRQRVGEIISELSTIQFIIRIRKNYG